MAIEDENLRGLSQSLGDLTTTISTLNANMIQQNANVINHATGGTQNAVASAGNLAQMAYSNMQSGVNTGQLAFNNASNFMGEAYNTSALAFNNASNFASGVGNAVGGMYGGPTATGTNMAIANQYAGQPMTSPGGHMFGAMGGNPQSQAVVGGGFSAAAKEMKYEGAKFVGGSAVAAGIGTLVGGPVGLALSVAAYEGVGYVMDRAFEGERMRDQIGEVVKAKDFRFRGGLGSGGQAALTEQIAQMAEADSRMNNQGRGFFGKLGTSTGMIGNMQAGEAYQQMFSEGVDQGLFTGTGKDINKISDRMREIGKAVNEMVDKFDMDISQAVETMGRMKRAGFDTGNLTNTMASIDAMGNMAGMSSVESREYALQASGRAHSRGLYGQSAALQSIGDINEFRRLQATGIMGDADSARIGGAQGWGARKEVARLADVTSKFGAELIGAFGEIDSEGKMQMTESGRQELRALKAQNLSGDDFMRAVTERAESRIKADKDFGNQLRLYAHDPEFLKRKLAETGIDEMSVDELSYSAYRQAASAKDGDKLKYTTPESIALAAGLTLKKHGIGMDVTMSKVKEMSDPEFAAKAAGELRQNLISMTGMSMESDLSSQALEKMRGLEFSRAQKSYRKLDKNYFGKDVAERFGGKAANEETIAKVKGARLNDATDGDIEYLDKYVAESKSLRQKIAEAEKSGNVDRKIRLQNELLNVSNKFENSWATDVETEGISTQEAFEYAYSMGGGVFGLDKITKPDANAISVKDKESVREGMKTLGKKMDDLYEIDMFDDEGMLQGEYKKNAASLEVIFDEKSSDKAFTRALGSFKTSDQETFKEMRKFSKMSWKERNKAIKEDSGMWGQYKSFYDVDTNMDWANRAMSMNEMRSAIGGSQILSQGSDTDTVKSSIEQNKRVIEKLEDLDNTMKTGVASFKEEVVRLGEKVTSK